MPLLRCPLFHMSLIRSVSIQSSGKNRLILDLRHVNHFIWKQNFRCEIGEFYYHMLISAITFSVSISSLDITGLACFILGILQDIFGDIESDEGLITMLDSIMASSTKVTNDRATFYKIFWQFPPRLWQSRASICISRKHKSKYRHLSCNRYSKNNEKGIHTSVSAPNRIMLFPSFKV